MIERSRKEILKHLLHDNLALCIGRQSSVIGSDKYDIVFITENLVDLNLFRRGGEVVFPLYLYPEKREKKKGSLIQMLMFEHEVKYETKLPNINSELLDELKKNFKKQITPEEIFYYIYSVLHSNIYRKKYEEFLKIDFPRIPFTKDYKLFIQLGKHGKQLADLHLLKSKDLDKTTIKFPKDGNNKIEKLKYENKKVWINKDQYFDGITEEVYKYQIGGYQVCEKWLKDRKERNLTLDEIKTYRKIVFAFAKTIELQKEIDNLYPEIEKKINL